MRLFKLNSSGEKFLPSPARQVGCVMAHPHDDAKREGLFTAWQMLAFQLFLSKQGDRAFQIPAQFALKMADFGGLRELSARIKGEITAAMEAGDIVGEIFLTAMLSQDVGAVRKPKSMATLINSISREMRTDEIREIYERNIGASHYWAAWIVLKGLHDEAGNSLYTQFPCTDEQLPWLLHLGGLFLERMEGFRTRDGVALCDPNSACIVASPVDDISAPVIEMEDFPGNCSPG